MRSARFFRAGDGPSLGDYQLDHVFADRNTEARVTGWRVNTRLAVGPKPDSDHAPIRVDLGS